MLEFIQLLKQRYQTIFSGLVDDDVLSGIYQERFEQLTLAEGFIKKGRLNTEIPEHPFQIAVIGPTQAGKSTLVNLLLNSSVAGVSPLAGFTVHPQGFSSGLQDQQLEWLADYFDDFTRLNQHELDKNRHHCYSLIHVEPGFLGQCLAWDTPDFDSIDAGGYREGILKTIALADIIVLVVSKEKYADQSVWEIMSLLEPLQQPTLIIVNKLSEEAEPVVLQSLQEKWQQARQDGCPEVIPLMYKKTGTQLTIGPEFSVKFTELTRRINRKKHSAKQIQLLNRHWHSWVEPVIAEQAASKEWSQLVEDCLKNALSNYQRDYLDHPHYYETFKNALAELLTLLEIPGLAKVMVKTRQILTWPVRQVFKLGGNLQHGLSGNSQEVALLNQISEHMLIQLSDRILDKIDQETEKCQWWKEINLIVRQQREAVLQQFSTAVTAYHVAFQQDVETTAQRLYKKLQDQPVTLNSLRATRVTTDAAAVALALKTGGIGLHDLVITPAMLSMTSFLAESALGSYMSRVEAELKQHQLATVKEKLFSAVLQNSLGQFPDRMSKSRHFNIPQSLLSEVEQQLTNKPNGLRLL